MRKEPVIGKTSKAPQMKTVATISIDLWNRIWTYSKLRRDEHEIPGGQCYNPTRKCERQSEET